jgi:hypothetical protein
MANKPGHRRFGNIRKLPSGRFQIRYPGPDSRMRTGADTYETKAWADRALSLIEAQLTTGEWTDPVAGQGVGKVILVMAGSSDTPVMGG